MEKATNSNNNKIHIGCSKKDHSECDSNSDFKDEVDFVNVSTLYNNNNNNSNCTHNNTSIDNKTTTNTNYNFNHSSKHGSVNNNNSNRLLNSIIKNPVPNKEITSKKKKADEINEKKVTAKERSSLFSFNKKLSQKQSNPTKSTVTVTATAPVITPNSTTSTSTIRGRTTTTSENAKTIAGFAESGFVEKVTDIHPTSSTASTPQERKFVKSTSIARFLGNTYNAKKFEKEEQKRVADDRKFHTYAGRRRHRMNGVYLERFRQCSKEDGDDANAEVTLDLRDTYTGSRNNLLTLEHPEEEDRNVDFSTKAMRTISRGLGKLFWRRSHSVEISIPDPEYKVSYLGNVLTGWAKGEGCVEKQLNTLWRNYTQNTKPDVVMRIKVCASGLKATTRQHGLTEYWANRITHCCAPKNYPRVFCWIYRHEGRKLKHELRCHAVLCSKEKIVQEMCTTLKENLECALREFKREKIQKQNARLSLANAAYENPSLPRRKILLSVGGSNYRPPLERSKSAPKLMAIEEAIGEEDGEEVEETNEPEMKPCCQKDSLYPAMTLGRRRCRRGHSIRRTGKTRPTLCAHFADSGGVLEAVQQPATRCCGSSTRTKEIPDNEECQTQSEEKRHSYGSDDSDDFEKLLKGNNYDSGNSLANELLPYFDLQLYKQTSSSLGSLSNLKNEDEDVESAPLSLLPVISNDPNAATSADSDFNANDTLKQQPVLVGLRRDGVCSDGEEDYLDTDDMYFRQASILNMLHRNSMRKMAPLGLRSDEGSIETTISVQYHHQVQTSISSNASSTLTSVSAAELAERSDSETQRNRAPPQAMDSDEGSISSGCETASTVTANQDDTSLRYRQSAVLPQLKQLVATNFQLHAEEEPPITAEEIYQRLESRLHGRHGSDATTFSSSSSVTLKLGSSPTPSLTGEVNTADVRNRNSRRPAMQQAGRGDDDSDSDCSDESGYVEYQVHERSPRPVAVTQPATKPLPPPKPKPMARHITGVKSKVGTTTMV